VEGKPSGSWCSSGSGSGSSFHILLDIRTGRESKENRSSSLLEPAVAFHTDDSSISPPPTLILLFPMRKRGVRVSQPVYISTGGCLFGRAASTVLCSLLLLFASYIFFCFFFLPPRGFPARFILISPPFFLLFFPPAPIIKTEPNDEYDSLGIARHSEPYYGRPRLAPAAAPVADPDACLVGGYPPCPPRRAAVPSSSPSSSSGPALHDLSPVAYSPTHAAPPMQESPGRPDLARPASPNHSSPLLRPQGSPIHLHSPGPHGYHPIYANSSPSSSPASHPSTPGGAVESPFARAYSPGGGQAGSAAGGSSPGLLPEDASPPPMAVTVKQEPQELDQMYLDDGELGETR